MHSLIGREWRRLVTDLICQHENRILARRRARAEARALRIQERLREADEVGTMQSRLLYEVVSHCTSLTVDLQQHRNEKASHVSGTPAAVPEASPEITEDDESRDEGKKTASHCLSTDMVHSKAPAHSGRHLSGACINEVRASILRSTL